jgi:DNA polymerase III delta prime subunit
MSEPGEPAADAPAASERGREVWIEKYRPQSLDDIVGQDTIVERLKSYINRQDLPHLLFAGPAGVGKCVTGETPVLTNGGLQRIEDVVGDHDGFAEPDGDLEVLTFDSGEFRYTAPSHVFGKEAEELVRVSTRDGNELTTTPEHQYLVLRNEGFEWVPADELEAGDRVVRPLDAPLPDAEPRLDWFERMDGDRTLVHLTESFAREHGIPVEENFVGKKKRVVRGLREDEAPAAIAEAADTTRKTVLAYRRDVEDRDLDASSAVASLGYLRSLAVPNEEIVPHVMAIQYVSTNNRRSEPIDPPTELTPALARFVGLAVSEARIDGGRVKFYNENEDLLDAFDTAARDCFGLATDAGTQKGVPYRRLGNKTLTTYLRACFDVFDGMAGGDGIGSTLLRGDSESRAAFLRAVFDAEGHVTDHGIIELSRKSGDLTTLLSYLLAGFGVPSRRDTDRKAAANGTGTEREYHTLYVSGASALTTFEDAVGFGIGRKADRLARNATRDANPNQDTMPVQAAIDDLCGRLALTRSELTVGAAEAETRARQRCIRNAEHVLDAATGRVEDAQEVIATLDRLEPDLRAIDRIPATWVGERGALEPMEARRPISESTGVRTDRLLEYSDGRRTPTADRTTHLLTEMGVLAEEPSVETAQETLSDAIDRLSISYARVADGLEIRNTDVINLLENDDHDLASLARFRSVAGRVREIANEMCSEAVLTDLRALDILARSDIYLDEVETTEQVTEAHRVYDLTVPRTRNYVAGAVPSVMHNTTSAVAIAKEIYGDDWQENFLELNASDQRGIDVVRDRIKSFARASFGGYDYRVIFLDEADALCLPPGTPVTTGPPSNPDVKPIEEVSEEGEPIPSVNFETNEVEPDRGQLLETGTADFYRVHLDDGREMVASPRHPFFVVDEDERLIERELRDLSRGDRIADFRDTVGLSECEACGEWTANSRFCSQSCKDDGHSEEMSGANNPRHDEPAWNRGLTKEDDKRVAAQANPGATNGNYGGEYHGPNPWEDPELAAELREKISEAMSGRELTEEHRRAIGASVMEHHRGIEVDLEEYEPYARRIVRNRAYAECEICGEERRTEGRDGIYVHHIDGDCDNNAEENLMLVCPRCHNFVCHDRVPDMVEGWRQNPCRKDITDGGRSQVETVGIDRIEFDHHGQAYNITMEGTPNFALGNGILTHNTSDAQGALRRTMEQFSNNTRFILSCNYSSQIIDPIQSRCAVFRFSPLGDDAVEAQVRQIAENEAIEVTEEGVDALVYAAAGDMRKAINGLQAAAVMGDTVDEEAVYAITSTARPEEIKSLVERALGGDFTAARSQLDDLLTESGIAGGDIIDQLHRSVWEFDIDDEAAVKLMDRVGEADYRITAGANEQIQLEALLASLALDEE